jgi:hypothetical protein
MVELFSQVFAIGAVAALAPVPILIVLPLVAGSRGLDRSWWFVSGFTGSLFIAGIAALSLASRSGTAVAPKALSAIGLVIGFAFLVTAARLVLQQRRQGGVPEAFALVLGGLSRRRGTALGVVAGALNPKTLPIFLTGVAIIAADGSSARSRSLALAILAGTASLEVALPPVSLTLAPGMRTTLALERVRLAVEPHIATMATLILALVGLVYLVAAVSGLRKRAGRGFAPDDGGQAGVSYRRQWHGTWRTRHAPCHCRACDIGG